MDADPDKVYLDQLSEPGPFEFSGLLLVNGPGSGRQNGIPGIKKVRSIQQLTEHSDALIFLLSVPPVPETITYALKKFKHLFFSSPSLLPDPKFPEYMKLAEEANVIIRIGNPARYHPSFLEVRKRSYKPAYIEFRRTGVPDLSSRESVKASFMADIEMALCLLKGQPRKIQTQSAVSSTVDPGILYARIEFDNGSSASFTYTPLHTEHTHRMNVYQPFEHFFVDFIQNKVTRSSLSNNAKETQYASRNVISETLEPSEMETQENRLNEIQMFYQDIRQSRTSTVSSEESFLAHALTLQIHQRLFA